jgi:hypothetical protein
MRSLLFAAFRATHAVRVDPQLQLLVPILLLKSKKDEVSLAVEALLQNVDVILQRLNGVILSRRVGPDRGLGKYCLPLISEAGLADDVIRDVVVGWNDCSPEPRVRDKRREIVR